MRPTGFLHLSFVLGAILTCGCLSSNKGQIEGTKWTSQAATVNGNELPAGGMELEFAADGSLKFRAGPQQFAGTYSLGMGDNVTFHFDQDFFGSKEHSEKIAISADQMNMIDPDGTTIPFVKVTASAATGWQPFESQAGGFSILTPSTLTEQTKPVGNIQLHLFTGYAGSGEYLVSYGDYLGQRPDADAAKVLDRVRDGAMKGMSARVLSESKITLGNHPGRELTFEASNNGIQVTGKMRLFLVGNRLYQMVVDGNSKELRASSTDKFLKSFKLLNEQPAQGSN